MLLNLFSYYWRLIRNDRFRDFFSEGLGIDARFNRAQSYWRRHLASSKQFQIQNISHYAPGWTSIAILGAGRLLDVPDDFLCEERGKSIFLFDADPGCLSRWSQFKRQALASRNTVEFAQKEITGKMLAWSDELKISFRDANLAKKNQVHAAKLIQNLEATKVEPPKFPNVDVVVSLNILGQLSVYWRLELQRILKRYGIDTKRQLLDVLESAIATTCAQLEQEHLQQILDANPKIAIILSDDEYYYYEKNRAQWQVEAALHTDFPDTLVGYNCAAKDSWLWHIAPQGIEDKKYGEIHRVQARAFVRNGK